MACNVNDPQLDQFLARRDVDDQGLAELHRGIESENPWKVACPEVLHSERYVINEHPRFLSVRRSYDVCDPVSGQTLITCREPKVGLISTLARMHDANFTSNVDLRCTDWRDEVVFRLQRKVSFAGAETSTQVYNQLGQILGLIRFEQEYGQVSGRIENNGHRPLVGIRGHKRELTFTRATQVIARVDRRRGGWAKEWFTEADTYDLTFSPELPPDDPIRLMILGGLIRADIGMDVIDRGKCGR